MGRSIRATLWTTPEPRRRVRQALTVLPRDPFTTADAAAADYSPPRIGVLVATGTWVALRRGVYCTAERLQASRWSPRSEHVLMIQAALLAVRRPPGANGCAGACAARLAL